MQSRSRAQPVRAGRLGAVLFALTVLFLHRPNRLNEYRERSKFNSWLQYYSNVYVQQTTLGPNREIFRLI